MSLDDKEWTSYLCRFLLFLFSFAFFFFFFFVLGKKLSLRA